MFSVEFRLFILWVVFFLSLFPRVTLADSWQTPQGIGGVSYDGNFVIRIDVRSESGGKTQVRAIWSRWQEQTERFRVVPLQDVPVRSLVSNSGDVVLLDRWWGNTDRGRPVVWIYSVDGKLVKSFKIEQLYSNENLVLLPRTTSNLRWITDTQFQNPKSLIISEALGGVFQFDLASGRFIYHPEVISPVASKTYRINGIYFCIGVFVAIVSGRYLKNKLRG